MNPRYFMTYRVWNGTETETATRAFGRFYSLESATREAQSKVALGYEILNVRAETALEAAGHEALRVFVRMLRIACACVLGFIAYIWIDKPETSVGDIPLAQITLNMIASNVVFAGLTLGAMWLGWLIAFGDARKIEVDDATVRTDPNNGG